MTVRGRAQAHWPLVTVLVAGVLAVIALILAVLVLRDPALEPVPVPSVSQI